MLTIHSLTLDHVAGVEHAHLELPDTGVVVVHGPNEMGKTTLLTAFQLLLSDLGVGTKKAWVKALKSVTTDEPTTVSATLTVGEHRLSVLKSFNKGGGRCELTVTAPVRESLTGRQAAERFTEILADNLDISLLDALTIEQGASLEILPTVGIRSLEQVLGEDTGGTPVPGGGVGEDAGTLIETITAEYSRYHTPGGKPTRELAAVLRDYEAAHAAHQVAQSRYTQAQGLILELERLSAEKDAIIRQEPEAAEARVVAENALEQGQAAVAELERHRSALTVAQGALDIAEERLAVRAGRVRELREAESTIAALEAAVEEASVAAVEEKRVSGALRAELSSAQHRARMAKTWSAYLSANQRRKQALSQVEELNRRCQDAETVAQEIRDIEARIQDNPATDQALELLRAADSALHRAVSIRDAVATAVEITGPDHADSPGDTGAVTVDGERRPLTQGSTTVHVTGQQVIGLGEYTVTITPARDVREISEDVTRAREEFRERIADVGVSDLREVEDLAEQRRQDAESLREASLRLAQIAGDATPEGLCDRRDRVAQEIEALSAAMAQTLERILVEDPEGVVDLPGVPAGAAVMTGMTVVAEGTIAETITAQSADLDQVAEEAAHEAERLHGELDRVTRAAASVRWESRKAELARAKVVRDRVNEALSRDREEVPDSELETVVHHCGMDVGTAQRALTEAQNTVGEVDLELLASLATSAAARECRLRERAVETGAEISRVTGALGEHTGVAEEVESAIADLERAEWNRHRVERQAAAASLLHHEVEAALRVARERYEAPLRATIERLARTLYAAPVQVEFDEELRVGRRFLDGVSLDTAQLSGGAREQLAVLTRLAVADLVGGGESVPVIIDDALGFSDRGRIGRMNVVLDALGEDHQIIVLTCDLDRFDGIAGAEVVPMSRVLGQS